MNSTKKLFFNLSIGASLLGVPVLAEENSGWYATGSIGSGVIGNIDYINANGRRTGQMVTFDSGLGLDLGFGYDFGSARVEGTWSRTQSPGGTDRGTVFDTDTTIDSLLLSGYIDFRSSKQWSPFIGISVGSTRVDHLNIDDSGTSYGLGLGISYKTSDTTEVYFKSTGIVTPELDTLGITNGTYGNGTIGVRFLF
ncbi:MAG: porin family protein [Prochlorococcus marinus CUG1435]|nr:porin family protein [Prochlorococcus marinus CUG1435]